MKFIDTEKWNRKSAYEYFKTFSNPCYSLDVEMDITELYKLGKETDTSFFVNMLYVVTYALNSIEEMRLRVVDGKVVLHDVINPAYTVMTDAGTFENAAHKYTKDYKEFYKRGKEEVNRCKRLLKVKDTYNDSTLYDEFYITCLPWITYDHMSHPMPDNDHSNSSVPRICWGKYFFKDDRVKIKLNITVSHMLVDGYPLSMAFLKIQEVLDNVRNYLK